MCHSVNFGAIRKKNKYSFTDGMKGVTARGRLCSLCWGKSMLGLLKKNKKTDLRNKAIRGGKATQIVLQIRNRKVYPFKSQWIPILMVVITQLQLQAKFQRLGRFNERRMHTMKCNTSLLVNY